MANEKLEDDLKEKKRAAEGMELVSAKIYHIISQPEKQPTLIWRRPHLFVLEMTSEKQVQKFHTDDVLLPTSP